MASDTTYQAKVHHAGPDLITVESGGEIDILSGGVLNAVVGTLQLSGVAVTATAAQINSAAAQTGVMSLNKTANYTLALGDNGLLVTCATDAVIFTLPATVVGYTFTIMNTAAAGAAAIQLSPNASDRIVGLGLNTVTDDKDFINTKATATPGDYITVVGDGTNGWFVVASKGTWAREA